MKYVEGSLSPREKRPGREVGHSPLSYAGINNTEIPHHNAVRLALIRCYVAIPFQPFLGRARFPPAVTLFVSCLYTFTRLRI
jgi:hypothetical protein